MTEFVRRHRGKIAIGVLISIAATVLLTLLTSIQTLLTTSSAKAAKNSQAASETACKRVDHVDQENDERYVEFASHKAVVLEKLCGISMAQEKMDKKLDKMDEKIDEIKK